ncbi:MAG: hypothetical protein IKH16_12160, partial [Selenomonadaceae bacterium]|nr:hypothetical protein [Selenomonadaceae bacterium]
MGINLSFGKHTQHHSFLLTFKTNCFKIINRRTEDGKEENASPPTNRKRHGNAESQKGGHHEPDSRTPAATRYDT